MSRRLTAALIVTMSGAFMSACPTRQNPELPDGWNAEGDTDPDADADGERCATNQHLCDDRCVSLSDPEHCGVCNRVCDIEVDGCDCRAGGGDNEYQCLIDNTGPPTTWEPCELE